MTKMKVKYSWAGLGQNMHAWYDKSVVKSVDVPLVSLSSFSQVGYRWEKFVISNKLPTESDLTRL